MKLIIFLALMSVSNNLFAWGGLGHNAICMAASNLVQEPELKNFLKNKGHVMGHLCNVPDTHWRNLDAATTDLNAPTHYVDVEILGVRLMDINSDYGYLQKKYTGQQNNFEKAVITNFHKDFGSNWWRAEQLFRKAVEQGKAAASAADENILTDKIYEFYVTLGLMGHFVGDNSQPFHLTADYDGFGAGHGGIHAYYEDAVVSEIGSDLLTKLIKKTKDLKSKPKKKGAKQNLGFLKSGTVFERMKLLGKISYDEIKTVIELDKVLKPSTVVLEKGMKLKTPAERIDPSKAVKKFEGLIITQMARSALLLAAFWDEAYRESGSPKLSGYKSYKFPFQPDFIAPDYL